MHKHMGEAYPGPSMQQALQERSSRTKILKDLYSHATAVDLADEASYCRHTPMYTKVSVMSCCNILQQMPLAQKPLMWQKVLSLAHDFLHEGGVLIWWDRFHDVNKEIGEMMRYMRSQRPMIRLELWNKHVPAKIYDYLVKCADGTEMRMLIWMRC